MLSQMLQGDMNSNWLEDRMQFVKKPMQFAITLEKICKSVFVSAISLQFARLHLSPFLYNK